MTNVVRKCVDYLNYHEKNNFYLENKNFIRFILLNIGFVSCLFFFWSISFDTICCFYPLFFKCWLRRDMLLKLILCLKSLQLKIIHYVKNQYKHDYFLSDPFLIHHWKTLCSEFEYADHENGLYFIDRVDFACL